MHAPHDPTWLDWLVGIVALVLWNFGPALARDALDPPSTGPDTGPAGGTVVSSGNPRRTSWSEGGASGENAAQARRCHRPPAGANGT